MQITKLEYQKKDPNRVNVYVDEKFAVGLETNDIIKLGLARGQEISQKQLNGIIGASEFGKLFNTALNFLSYRPRSEWEVQHKLKFKSQNAKLVDAVVEKLKGMGQINDEEFAQWYTDQRRTFRPKGKRAIEMELRRKGVQSDTIKQLSSNPINEVELAKRALEKFRGEKTRPRLERFLASRGFDWQTIEDVVK
ncbi:MAG: RecX family transcriptional regulator [Patescibacteria group bacterium]|nr:RecX family transcriptional regulator [Patescibacteria group bacterium]MCL5431778.1 RecX family transcriptional regulator [Patescibacteria group bacterium]